MDLAVILMGRLVLCDRIDGDEKDRKLAICCITLDFFMIPALRFLYFAMPYDDNI